MKRLDQKSVDFIKSYNYDVIIHHYRMLITDNDQSSPVINIVMIVVGLTGIPIAFLGNYQIGIVFLLLLAVPIFRIANSKSKKTKFDFLNQRIRKTDIADIREFRYIKSEALTYATAMEDGVTEYTLTLEMVKKNGVATELLSFIDRDENKPGAEELLNEMNGWLTPA